MYPILALIFFSTLIVSSCLVIGFVFVPSIWKRSKSKILTLSSVWFFFYGAFILFFTGPVNLSQYPAKETSPYRLPWAAGVTRFVAQGNRSFTSHRDFHQFAWDFVMPNGTKILAARDGQVAEIEDSFDGIGLKSNYIIVRHDDGERSAYAHVRHRGALVKVGDGVKQGQPIALSGMVGQTLFPHVHFYVIGKDGTSSIPISFFEVPGGVPLAGRFYTSENLVRAECISQNGCTQTTPTISAHTLIRQPH